MDAETKKRFIKNARLEALHAWLKGIAKNRMIVTVSDYAITVAASKSAMVALEWYFCEGELTREDMRSAINDLVGWSA